MSRSELSRIALCWGFPLKVWGTKASTTALVAFYPVMLRSLVAFTTTWYQELKECKPFMKPSALRLCLVLGTTSTLLSAWF